MSYRLKCPCCFRTVSSDAYYCPHCGKNIHAFLKGKNMNAPHVEVINKHGRNSALVLLGIIILLMLLGGSAILASVYTCMLLFLAISIGEISTGTIFMIGVGIFVSLLLWAITIFVGVVLVKKAKRYIKKQNSVIDHEMSFMVGEEDII